MRGDDILVTGCVVLLLSLAFALLLLIGFVMVVM